MFETRVSLATGFAAGSVVTQILATLLAGLMVCSIYNYRAQPRPASAMSMARSRSLAGSPYRAGLEFPRSGPMRKSSSNRASNNNDDNDFNDRHDQHHSMRIIPISRNSSIEVWSNSIKFQSIDHTLARKSHLIPVSSRYMTLAITNAQLILSFDYIDRACT